MEQEGQAPTLHTQQSGGPHRASWRFVDLLLRGWGSLSGAERPPVGGGAEVGGVGRRVSRGWREDLGVGEVGRVTAERPPGGG